MALLSAGYKQHVIVLYWLPVMCKLKLMSVLSFCYKPHVMVLYCLPVIAESESMALLSSNYIPHDYITLFVCGSGLYIIFSITAAFCI